MEGKEFDLGGGFCSPNASVRSSRFSVFHYRMSEMTLLTYFYPQAGEMNGVATASLCVCLVYIDVSTGVHATFPVDVMSWIILSWIGFSTREYTTRSYT